MRVMRSASPSDRDAIRQAIAHLRAARRLLVDSGSPRAAAAARRALASADGAARHVDHRLRRAKACAPARDGDP